MTATLDEAKAYLRIDGDGEDALIARLIVTATALCEQFIGQVLVARTVTETVAATGDWRRLRTTPVRSITSVQGLPATGVPFALAVDAYAVDIDASGDGWVRVMRPGGASRALVTLEAGITTHDRDLVIGGLPYRAAPGMLPSAISLSDGFDVDTLDVSGALTDAAISADDLAAGRWDGARVRLFAVDWSDPGAGTLALARGELGDVSVRDGGFSAELRGPTALLERPVVEQTSPECRAELGDRRCRVDMAGRRIVTRVAAVIDAVTIEVAADEGERGRLWLWPAALDRWRE